MKQSLPVARQSAAPINGPTSFRRLFDDFPIPMLRFGNGDVMPDTDYAETDKSIVVTAELPGVDPKDVEITFGEGTLSIRGEKKSEREEEKADYWLSERSFGSFERVMRIPNGVDAGKVTAEFANGVLTVTLPKSPSAEAKSQKIEIKTAQ